LKRETASLHRRLEAQFELLDPEVSIERYRRVLQTLLGFYDPVEAGLARLLASRPAPGFSLQARARLIELDLTSLGMSGRELAELPRCAELPSLSCTEELAGCLYVLEGACLGGKVIAPVLQRRLGVAKGTGASFFTGDPAGTAARWTAFLAWLERLVSAGAQSEEIVASARSTFLAFAQWAELQGAASSPPR
jgi:heme oxygenase